MFEPATRAWPATLVPREKLGNLRRWQTTEFATPETAAAPPPASAPEPVDEQALHEARLAEERGQARAAGHEEGLRSGREEGLRQGQAQGHDEGYAAGLEAGLREGREAARIEAAALHAVLQECTRAVAGLHESVGPALLHLAREMARQIVRAELKLQPELIAAVVRDVMDTDAATQCAATVYLHPEDAALVASHAGDALADSGWRVAVDESLARGGCRVQSAYGDIDATLQTRWREICAAAGGDTPWPD